MNGRRARVLGVIRRRGPVLVALLVAGVTAFQAGRLLRAERMTTGGEISLPLDDSFIYLQYSRAIAEGHPFVYTPGNAPTTGATSLWYPLLLLPPHLLGLSPSVAIAWSLALGFAAYALSALLMARLGTRLGGIVGGALALALFLMSPHLLWGYASGMEIALYGTVLLATLVSYLRERESARFPRTVWWLFALAGARPEGALLCGVLGIVMLLDRRRAARLEAGPAWSWSWLLPFLAAAFPFLVNVLVSGSIEATSSQAKSILAEPYQETRRAYLAGAPFIWRDIAKVYWAMILLEDGRNVPPALGWINGVGALLFAGIGFARRRMRGATAALLALVAAGIVASSLPVHWYVHVFRYLHGLLPLVLLLVAAGWGRAASLVAGAPRLPRGVAAAGAALVGVIPLAIWAPRFLPEQRTLIQFYAHNCENILHQQVAVGRWIDRSLPRDAIVGMNDAGAIAYYGRRRTLDLVGLTTAGYARVYRSGLGCLFEQVRREPPSRKPTYFAIYPEWFPYWPESGLLGPEAFRAHLALNTICGGTTKIVYPATWIDVPAANAPVLASAALEGRKLVDSIDLAWLEDERRHDWRAEPEAKDVLRQYAYADRPTRPLTDGGRIVPSRQSFRVRATPGRDLTLILRTDAWYASRLRVRVDGRDAGVWSIPRSETAWIEPSFTIPAALVADAELEVTLAREGAGGGNVAPFHLWVVQ